MKITTTSDALGEERKLSLAITIESCAALSQYLPRYEFAFRRPHNQEFNIKRIMFWRTYGLDVFGAARRRRTSVQAQTAISWRALPAVRLRLVLSLALSHRIAAVGTPLVAHARSNSFSLGVVLDEMLLTRRRAA
jgi:hypothetical protein